MYLLKIWKGISLLALNKLHYILPPIFPNNSPYRQRHPLEVFWIKKYLMVHPRLGSRFYEDKKPRAPEFSHRVPPSVFIAPCQALIHDRPTYSLRD